MIKQAIMPLNDYISACDKIREKTGKTELIKSGELAEEIEAVYQKGTESGAEPSDSVFWDLFTNYGKRTFYGDAFRSSAFEYIRPSNKIVPTEIGSATRTFTACKSLKKLEAEYFDFSQVPRGSGAATGFYNTFSACSVLEEIEDIGLENQKHFAATFNWCISLKKIARIGVDEETVYDITFGHCGSLEEVTFEGVIGQNGLSFADSPLLTHATIMNVINCLKDFRETVVEDCGVNVSMPFILTTNTLVEGAKYYLTYEGDDFEPYTAEATAGQVTVMPSGISALGLEFELPSQTSGDIPLIWVYQDGGNLMYDAYFIKSNAKITLSKAPTEKRTVTLGATNLAKLTDAEKVVATQKGWTLL